MRQVSLPSNSRARNDSYGMAHSQRIQSICNSARLTNLLGRHFPPTRTQWLKSSNSFRARPIPLGRVRRGGSLRSPFRRPGTRVSSIDVYIEPCPRFTCFTMPMIDVYAPADLFPAGSDSRLGKE